jgi:type I restriction enzyme S subunit
MVAKFIAPKLRFKDLGEGAFPIWLDKNLGDETIWSSGGTPSKQEPSYWNGDIPWISASTMRGIEYHDSEFKITQDGLVSGSKLAPKDSLLLLVRGSMLFNKIPVGLAGRDVAFNQDVKCIKTKAAVKPCFLLYWFFANEHKLLNMVSGTGIGAGKLDTAQLQSMRLLVPSIDEQTKIANFLTAVDAKISQLTKKHELLTSYKKGVMQKIFSQELRFKDDDGREFAEWEHKPISETLTIGSGRDYKHLGPGLIPVYGTGGFMLSVDDFLYDGVSVCIGRKGTIDKPVLLSGKFWTVDTLFYTHNFIKCIPEFIYACFQTINWKQYCEASGVPSLSKSTIEKIEINLPCIQEQTKIANFLTAIDDKITNVKSQLEAAKEYKQGLLQQMFV